ncbi:NAD-dependent epimerase/dehydratase family protein [Aeromicrobium terrae]|uniref:NAD-dependent epimerase/dehydratase family protein n=1 Tax=Aeromicrobium terrae TaxID=2498846 RepID=A0A5C8NDY9_9ACTN|nr:NAD-dependent epimerase/dehydratase family protein [Aeromicrobium terrae]TXL56557.1 NAD-dependent epimerase/dehydratase family protein [Aeromicrobium terrae]
MTSFLVLGGTAWLGREVAREAAARGHDVTCLARGESGDAPPGVRFVRGDRDDPLAYDDLTQQRWDAVVDVTRQPGHARSAVLTLGDLAGHWTFVSTGNVYADLSVPLVEDAALLEPLADDVATPELYGEGKVACEQAVTALPNHLVLRAGLLGGPGDPSDRLGYWVARFARDPGPALVPDVPDLPVQVLDVRDLATFIVDAALRGVTGVMNTAGTPLPFAEVLAMSAGAAGHDGSTRPAAADWLAEHDVQPWMGPRSLSLWIPDDALGMVEMDTSRAAGAGLARRPLAETLADIMADERARGLDRERRAGLTAADEAELLAAL